MLYCSGRAALGARRVTPGEISEKFDRLRAAGAKLRRRPAQDTLAILGHIIDTWRDPNSPWRRALVSALPEATGFSTPVVAEGANRGFQTWSRAAMDGLLARDLGHPTVLDSTSHLMVSGFETHAVVLAGQVPMPTVLAMIAPLMLRSPVLAKPSSRDPVTPQLVLRSVSETDAELGQCLDLASFPGSDGPCSRALAEADCVVATGSDASIAAIGALVRPRCRLVSYGHRVSVAALGPAASDGGALACAAEGLALDVALWDQLGCLSPIAVYVIGPGLEAADRVAEALAGALGRLGSQLPRGRVESAAAAQISHERAEAEMRLASGRPITLHSGDGWTVVRESDAAVRPSPLHRFVRIHPVPDEASLLDALGPLGPHLAAVALAGFGEQERLLARSLADLGVSRLCRPGVMQSPPFDWHHDGASLLTPIARFTDLEPQ